MTTGATDVTAFERLGDAFASVITGTSCSPILRLERRHRGTAFTSPGL